MEFCRLSVEESMALLKTNRQGLASAEVGNRQIRYGENLIRDRLKTPWWRLVLEPFTSAFVVVLGLGGMVSWAIGHRNDAAVIGLVILVNAIIEWFQRASAARVLASLRRYSAKVVRVRREGKVSEIDSVGLVPGDIMLLSEGEKIPADGRLLEAYDLRINESALTGESNVVAKNSARLNGQPLIYQQTNMVFTGTLVEFGQAEVLVTAIGDTTEFGRIAELAAKPSEPAPIIAKIKSLTLRLILGSLGLSILAVGLGWLQGQDPLELLRFGVALMVSIIPEGLPVTLTIILLLGVRRMARKQAFVRNLPAVETLGMVTAIATDKTGTLTQNRMAIAEFWDLDGSLSTDDNTDLWLSVSHAHPDLIHPIEKLITQYSEGRAAPGNWTEIASSGFDNQRRLTIVAWRKDQEFRVYVKGAPEAIIDDCDLSADQLDKLNTKLAQMTSGNMRVIAVAKLRLSHPPADLDSLKLADMDFEGLIGFADQLRQEARSAVEQTRAAGIKVYMLTGDHLNTARTIGQAVGIASDQEAVVEGQALVKADGSGLRRLLAKTRVFARVLPEHKFRLLQALKQTEIAAMTGDGVNDAPALAKADVGIAMGSGTDVAKEAADIVLLDDNYQTIVEAIREGRRIYANVRKIIYYQLSTNLAEALSVVGGLVLGLPLVMTAAQILWLNLVTDTTMIIPLGMEAAEAKQMRSPPRSPRESLLSNHLLSRLILTVIVMAACSVAVFVYFSNQNLELGRTMAFLSLCTVQWATGFNSRSEYEYSWWGFIRPRHHLWYGVAIGAVLVGLAVYGPLQNYIGTVAVSPAQLLILIPAALITMAVGDLHKWWLRRAN